MTAKEVPGGRPPSVLSLYTEVPVDMDPSSWPSSRPGSMLAFRREGVPTHQALPEFTARMHTLFSDVPDAMFAAQASIVYATVLAEGWDR